MIVIQGGPSTGVLAWIALILAVLLVCRYLLGYKFTEFFKMLMKEFRELAKLNWNEKSLNALGISVISVLIIAFGFFTTAAKIFQSALNNGQYESTDTIIMGSTFVLAILTIVCLKVVSPK